jgi:hypothetical protein
MQVFSASCNLGILDAVALISRPFLTLDRKPPMTTTGKLDLTIKINELPQAKTLQNGWQYFELDCDARIVSVSVKPKIWKKLTDAQANFPMWVAAIAPLAPRVIGGEMGQATADGFELEQPSIQVFEKKPKAEASPALESVIFLGGWGCLFLL